MKRIVLADNQSLFLAGMVKVIAAEGDMRIVAQSADIEHLRQAVKNFRSSIVITASSLKPNIRGLVRAISAMGGNLIVIAANTESAKVYPNEVKGVVFRMTSGQDLLACIRAVASGKIYRQEKSQFPSFEDNGADIVVDRVCALLTLKEMQVLGLIAIGYKNRDIADRLGTSEQVIKNYLKSIYDKVGISGRVPLALFTISHNRLAQAAARALEPLS